MSVRRFHFPFCALLRLAVALALTIALLPAVHVRLAPPPTALAAAYIVNNLNDTTDGSCDDGTCTLRDAILAANANSGADTISFSASGTVVLSSLLPVVEEHLTIDGTGQTVMLDGNHAVRVLRANAPLTVTSLTVQNGLTDGEGAGALFFSAGTLINTTFISNTAQGTGGGGAHFWSSGTVVNSTFINNAAPNGSGGGAHFVSTATVTSTTFISNTAPTGSGGGAHFNVAATVSGANFVGNTAQLGGGARFGGQATVTATSFTGNTALDGNGGGARFGSTATVINTTFIDNSANNGMGGGARFDGTSTVTGATFSDNSAMLGGGADFVQPTVLIGSTFVANAGTSGGGGAAFAQTATISSTTFISNTAPSGSGGGARLEGISTLYATTFSHNSAGGTGGGGGALFISPASIQGATFTSNVATLGTGGGARFLSSAAITGTTFMSNTAAADRGGGTHLLGLASVTSSTFIGNEALDGGGLATQGANSVLHGNLLQGNIAGDTGGGVYVALATGLSLSANRVLDNAAGNGGGIAADGAGLSLDNNLLAGNTATDPDGLSEIALLGDATRVVGRHNTLASSGGGVAVGDNASALGQTIVLTNTIFDGYTEGVVAGAASTVVDLAGVLWSNVTTPVQGTSVTVANAITGTADFVDPAANDYHLQSTSDAFNAGVDAGLTTDFEGEVRPQFAAFDFGFDEILNRSPTTVADQATTAEDTPVIIDVLANDADPDSTPISLSGVTVADTGTAIISGTTQVVYTPPLNFTGQASFSYTVTDGENLSTAVVTVTVTPVNDPPTIAGPGNLRLLAGISSGPVSFTVTDVDAGDTLTVTATSTNTVLVPNANIALSGTGSARTVTIKPAAEQTGQAQIILSVTDSHGETAQGNFLVTVDFGILLPVLRR